MKKRTQQFIVTVPVVEDVSKRGMADYIRTAVTCWSGGGDPTDPLFEAFGPSHRQRVTVKPLGVNPLLAPFHSLWKAANAACRSPYPIVKDVLLNELSTSAEIIRKQHLKD